MFIQVKLNLAESDQRAITSYDENRIRFFFFLDWKASMTLHLTNPYHTRNIYTGDISYSSYQAIMLTINLSNNNVSLLKPDTQDNFFFPGIAGLVQSACPLKLLK